MSEEPLTLAELQTAKDTLETKARHLRGVLRELRRTKPDGWQEAFADTQAELIRTTSQIGALNRRITHLVEKEAGPAREEDDTDV